MCKGCARSVKEAHDVRLQACHSHGTWMAAREQAAVSPVGCEVKNDPVTEQVVKTESGMLAEGELSIEIASSPSSPAESTSDAVDWSDGSGSEWITQSDSEMGSGSDLASLPASPDVRVTRSSVDGAAGHSLPAGVSPLLPPGAVSIGGGPAWSLARRGGSDLSFLRGLGQDPAHLARLGFLPRVVVTRLALDPRLCDGSADLDQYVAL